MVVTANKISTASEINYSMVLVPGEEHNGIPYEESVDWLDQFYPCSERIRKTKRKILLVVGGESPTEVWSLKNNNINGKCYLEWKAS